MSPSQELALVLGRIEANGGIVLLHGTKTHLQMPRSRLRPHFVKAKVRVHQYCDGTHAIFHGPQCLARYQSNGELIEKTIKWAA